MLFLHTWHPSPVIVTFGGLTIYWYGLMLALGAVAGWFLIQALARRANIPSPHVSNLFLMLVIAGLLGARIYHVLNELPYYLQHPLEMFAIWHGGLAIHGAIITGVMVVWWYARKNHLNFWNFTDVLVPGLALGQAIGRWGNYFNQELFGRPTSQPWGIPIDESLRPAGYKSFEYFHPTFLYESLGNVIIVAGLVLILGRRSRPGTVTLLYFFLYAVLRITTESLRIDRTPIILGMRLPILVSASIIVAVALTWFFLRRPISHESTRSN